MSGKVSAEAEPRDNRKKTTSKRYVASAKTKIVRRVDESGYGARHPIIPVLPGPVETEWAETRLDAVCERINIPIDMAELSGREWLHYSIPALEETGGPLIQDGDSIDSSKLVVQSGDVLISKLNPRKSRVTTVSGIEELRTIASTEFVALRPRMVENGFLSWLLQSEPVRALLASRVESATRSHQRVNPDDITKLRACLPAPVDQTRIANFLDEKTARIDAVIAEKERFAACMEEYRCALIYALVTRGSGESMVFPTHVAWLGGVPAHWKVVPIKHVARLESGHTPDKKVSSYWENCDIPWVSLNDTGRLLTLDYIDETTVNINQAGLQNSSARLLPEGTVFFSRDATIGRCGIAARPMACSQHFIGWVCGPHLLPEYLLYVLRSMSGELERLTAGATLKTIGMDDVKKLSIPLPPLEEQRTIVAMARSRSAEGVRLERCARMSVDLLREYRASLISAAVTGQLDIAYFGGRIA